MDNIKRSIEYARQASSVFVKPLAQQIALAELGNKRHSRFALHPRSTTIRLRIKQGMAAAQAQIARERGSRCAKEWLRLQHGLPRQCL